MLKYVQLFNHGRKYIGISVISDDSCLNISLNTDQPYPTSSYFVLTLYLNIYNAEHVYKNYKGPRTKQENQITICEYLKTLPYV